MTKSELDQIRARADAATPGPWYYEGTDIPGMRGWVRVCNSRGFDIDEVCWSSSRNSNFVSAARTDVPALCDALEAAMRALAVAHELLDTGNYYDDDAREHGQQLLRQWRVD